MELKLVILRDGTSLISQVAQLEYEPRCHLRNPHVVSGKTKVTLSQFPAHTDDEDILIYSDALLTICEATEKLRVLYLEKIGKTLEDLNSEPERVMLNEDETIPEGEDYEPAYVEDPIY